ncbi:MAG: LysE family translocator [Gammaproteobacteria bacterium]|nr:LysE family translocator [Gammaproteobacteria bacterium]NNF62008.1 LysE family translocator [Gammaproteobacteria bacterium]NNM20945.1 LysE family translocator [Gammaproteobacteria bacterium]
MTINLWLAYVATVLLLMSTPGPSHLLMLSNSIGGGFPRSLATAAGDLCANLLQMIVAAAGLAGVITGSRELFLVVKWAGVAYLVWLGVRMFFRPVAPTGSDSARRPNLKTLYWQGFITSAANPKAVVFFAALFPQFLDPANPVLPQFAALSATYLVIDALFLLGYGRLAQWLSGWLQASAGRALHRGAGMLLVVAAILLGLRSIEPQQGGIKP